MQKSTIFKLALSLATTVNIAVPYLKRGTNPKSNRQIIKMKRPKRGIDTGQMAYYILPGILCPPYREYNHFVQGDGAAYWMKGDCFFVDYGPDYFDPASMAILVADHIKANHFKEVRLLTISIGDQIVPYLANALLGSDVTCKSWAISPVVSPDYLNNDTCTLLRISAPFLGIAKILLGWLGQKRIIPWDCVNRSFAEIADQARTIIYNDYDYDRSGLPSNFEASNLIFSDDDEFMDPGNYPIYDEHLKCHILPDLKHCRFHDDWPAYLEALHSLGFYNPYIK